MSASGIRVASAILTEAHMAMLRLVAALLLAGVVVVLVQTGGRWRWLAGAAAIAAAAALLQAVLPWLSPRGAVRVERPLAWSAFGVTIGIAFAALVVLGVRAFAAAQLLLVAAVLGELRGRRLVLASLWAALLLGGGAIALYYALVPLRPVPD